MTTRCSIDVETLDAVRRLLRDAVEAYYDGDTAFVLGIPGDVYLSEFAGGCHVVSVTEPLFCVTRHDRTEAIKAAVRILRSYLEWKSGTGPP